MVEATKNSIDEATTQMKMIYLVISDSTQAMDGLREELRGLGLGLWVIEIIQMAPYHEPFCLDIYISKASIRACIVHRATSKVVAVAHSISKDMKFDLGSTRNAAACAAVGKVLAQRALADDIHNVVYTPRKGEKLEGKLQIVLQFVINDGVRVKLNKSASFSAVKSSNFITQHETKAAGQGPDCCVSDNLVSSLTSSYNEVTCKFDQWQKQLGLPTSQEMKRFVV
ncbi:Ribosomal protein L18/L5 [Cynara cardunculus var. scolymus]|uniref:Ribosomal protein L18/L5 n=1 Tax=Cynara cardunculus var. scolymus TaxID=59895 RepID=A0A103Y367_CYNCS|nr:Ribosomal protein L18/L5 [Cynara cardunculus var. scolymus]